jgi:NADH-quinone oxidoreductase subunit C
MPDAFHQLVNDTVVASYPDAIEEVVEFREEYTLIVKQDQLVEICILLRDEEGLQFNFLEDIVADDMLPEFPRYAVNYHLFSISNSQRVRLRVPVEDPDDGPETVGSVWKIGTWLEMEVWDLMGITFKGNNKLRRLFLPEDWQGHPLRKDYPLGYEEVQFSFNWEAIDAKKPYAKD